MVAGQRSKMKQQSFLAEFSRYTSLSVFGTLGVSCYILADTFFIAKGLGTNGLAALNLAIPVYNFIHGTGLMLGMGGATKFSIYKSQKKPKEINRIYTNTIWLALLFSCVFFSLGLFFQKQLSFLLGADAEVQKMTETYLHWLLLFAPAFLLNDVLLCFVRNDNGPQLSMAAMLLGSFSNIILDYIFIFSMQMGIFGAVFATGLSPVISIAAMLPHWIKKKNTFRFVKTKMHTNMTKDTLSLGFPSLITQLSSGIVMITFNAVILKLEGNTGVAAYGVIANLALVTVALYTGIAQGVQPLISRFYGMGNGKQAGISLRYAMITMLAVSGLKLYFTSSVFTGYNIILATFFTSVERAFPAHILSLLRGFVLIIPMAFILSALWGMTGVWLTYPLTELLAAVPGYVMFRRYRAQAEISSLFKISSYEQI